MFFQAAPAAQGEALFFRRDAGKASLSALEGGRAATLPIFLTMFSR